MVLDTFTGKKKYSVQIYSGYCPNPLTRPLLVYAQHRQYLINKKDDRCPRLAFIQDLCEDIKKAMVQGDKIVLMLDCNMDMKQGIMANHFKNIMLKEAIIDEYGSNGPSIFRQIKTKTPIDGIWISKEIHITQGGYLNFDLISSTDHQCLWVDISFALLLGHKMPPFPSPKTWHLHCRDPWIVNNYVRKFEKLAKQHHLLEKVKNLDAVVHYPINSELIYQYETLDATQCEITIAAEQKCRKLRKGQVAFSPELQLASNKIRAYIFLIKRKKGEKLSSMQLARTLRKAGSCQSFAALNGNS
jgi:hypothetical protein